jgi:primosomal protein N'
MAFALVSTLPLLAEEEKKPKETPEEAFNAFKAAVKKGDADACWNFFSSNSRKKLVDMMAEMMPILRGDEGQMKKMAEDLEMSLEDVKKMEDKELAEKAIRAQFTKKLKEDPEELEKMKWLGCEVDGDRAIAKTEDKDGKVEKVVLVVEAGT